MAGGHTHSRLIKSARHKQSARNQLVGYSLNLRIRPSHLDFDERIWTGGWSKSEKLRWCRRSACGKGRGALPSRSHDAALGLPGYRIPDNRNSSTRCEFNRASARRAAPQFVKPLSLPNKQRHRHGNCGTRNLPEGVRVSQVGTLAGWGSEIHRVKNRTKSVPS